MCDMKYEGFLCRGIPVHARLGSNEVTNLESQLSSLNGSNISTRTTTDNYDVISIIKREV